uniref:Uncharacterized protein n=1 Tax=Pyramimonas orientalis virus TaxID=455367 RepID=A0A7M3UPF1_POV01|nr:hypothetical protein HWQ62_00507 [Pyramimonas orientalis virus]
MTYLTSVGEVVYACIVLCVLYVFSVYMYLCVLVIKYIIGLAM